MIRIHYPTRFLRPQAVAVDRADGSVVAAMRQSEPGLAEVLLEGADQDLLLHFRDGSSGAEDRPPGGDEYRIPFDLTEAWIWSGAVFDRDPRSWRVGLIDAHTHPFRRLPDGRFTADARPLLQVERAGTGISLALTMVDGSLAFQRDFLLPVCRGNPWLVPLAWIDPRRDDPAEADALLRAHGFRGLKLHPTISDYPADGPRMDPFLAVARRLRVPIQVHCATDDASAPERIAALARRHPDVAIVMVHTELGARDKRHALEVVRALPHVSVETSWTDPDGILLAMERLDSSRTLFGTDSSVDGSEQFTRRSIEGPGGRFLTILEVVEEVRARAHPDAFRNWAWLTATRLYGLGIEGLGRSESGQAFGRTTGA